MKRLDKGDGPLTKGDDAVVLGKVTGASPYKKGDWEEGMNRGNDCRPENSDWGPMADRT